MTAMTVEREPAAAAVPPPAAQRLTERQLLGIDCARCGACLGVHALRLGEIEDRGDLLQLFGCDPACVRLPRRRPMPGPAAQPAAVPPWCGSPLYRLPRWTAASDGPDPLADSYHDDPETVRRVVAGLRALSDIAPPAPRPQPPQRPGW